MNWICCSGTLIYCTYSHGCRLRLPFSTRGAVGLRNLRSDSYWTYWSTLGSFCTAYTNQEAARSRRGCYLGLRSSRLGRRFTGRGWRVLR